MGSALIAGCGSGKSAGSSNSATSGSSSSSSSSSSSGAISAAQTYLGSNNVPPDSGIAAAAVLDAEDFAPDATATGLEGDLPPQ